MMKISDKSGKNGQNIVKWKSVNTSTVPKYFLITHELEEFSI